MTYRAQGDLIPTTPSPTPPLALSYVSSHTGLSVPQFQPSLCMRLSICLELSSQAFPIRRSWLKCHLCRKVCPDFLSDLAPTTTALCTRSPITPSRYTQI